jgi:hypothetical protein
MNSRVRQAEFEAGVEYVAQDDRCEAHVGVGPHYVGVRRGTSGSDHASPRYVSDC